MLPLKPAEEWVGPGHFLAGLLVDQAGEAQTHLPLLPHAPGQKLSFPFLCRASAVGAAALSRTVSQRRGVPGPEVGLLGAAVRQNLQQPGQMGFPQVMGTTPR